MAFRTSNPALNDSTWENLPRVARSTESMTVQGTVGKAALLLLLLMISASFVWNKTLVDRMVGQAQLYMMIGLIGGLITSLVIIFVKTTAPYLSPVYALLEGLAIGGISAFANASYPGLVLPAVMLTFATLGALLFLYQTRIIRATDKFKMGVVGATGAIFLVYMLTFVLGLFKIQIPLIHSSGLIGIGFSLFVVGIAALTLVLDFDFIENGAAQNAPKYMEWYGAFGLIVTLIWLYLEILRLLMKLQDRRR